MGTATAIASTPLCKLAEKYGTDKLGFYTPAYDLLLRGRTVFKMLEVGIGTRHTMSHVKNYRPGASLRMWKEYFLNDFGPIDVCGMDINPNVCAEVAEEGIKTFCADSTNTHEILEIVPKLVSGGKFDLIIDDGDHKPESQIKTLQNLSALLVTGGLYIIEDARGLREIEMSLPDHTSIENYFGQEAGYAIIFHQETLCPSKA